jgi:hypothetical protein
MKSALIFLLLCIAGIVVALTFGAGQPAPLTAAPGFWLGLVHGATAPFALVASLFAPVRIYAVPNAGFLYDLGFIGGFCALLLALAAAGMARIGGMIS